MSNVSFITTRHISVNSDSKESKVDDIELENYLQELSDLEDSDVTSQFLEQAIESGKISPAWPKVYEDMIRNADFAIGDARSLNLQMRAQWFKDLACSSKSPPRNGAFLSKKAEKVVEGLGEEEVKPVTPEPRFKYRILPQFRRAPETSEIKFILTDDEH